MSSHRKPREPGEQPKPWKRRRLVPLGVVLCLGAAAFGGSAVAGVFSNRTPLTLNLADAPGSTAPGVTMYACLASGRLTHVSVTAAPKCPANSVPVQWTGHSGVTASATPQPSKSSAPPASSPPAAPSTAPPSSRPPSSSPPSTAPPTAAPTTSSAAPTGPQCVTSALHGSCGPYDYSGITGSGGSNTFVLNNMWGANSSTTQTLTATSPGSWTVLANTKPAGSTAVQTYPDTQEIYTRTNDTPLPLSGFSSIVSSFTEKMGAAAGTDAEAAYDIWLGQSSSTNYRNEVMIWNDQVNRGTCGGATVKATATFGGSNGVPQQNWTLCEYGGTELIWYLSSGNEQSGTVDVLSMLTWLESHGYRPAGSGLNQIDYGFEICSTPSAEAFTVSQFGIKSS
jgi:hypothetical protein